MNPIRRSFLQIAAPLGLALSISFVAPSLQAQGQKTLKFIAQADLKILDPIATTAYITRNHGYMVYDKIGRAHV